MGSSCTKSNESQVLQPQNQQEFSINNELSQYLRIDHPYNVNLKYQSFCLYIKNEFTGNGIKRTHSYKTKLTKDEITKKRDEFWDTRVEGQKHSWLILRNVVEEEQEQDGLAMMAAGGLKLVSKSLQIAYDESYHKYDIPIFCINDPKMFETISAQEKNLIKQFEEEEITIRIRCSKLQDKDQSFTIKNSTLIEDFIKQFIHQNDNLEIENMRLFVDGQEIYANNQFGNYPNVKNDKIVQSFAFSKKIEKK